jgi:hypothetical protein
MDHQYMAETPSDDEDDMDLCEEIIRPPLGRGNTYYGHHYDGVRIEGGRVSMGNNINSPPLTPNAHNRKFASESDPDDCSKLIDL